MRTLAIETSCDDTSLAIVSDTGEMIVCEKLVTKSQTVHQKYGGVVPELASRAHSDDILIVLADMLHQMQWTIDDLHTQIDSVSVTMICGLPGSLVVGKTLGYFLGHRLDKPVISVNHVYGHVLSLFLDRPKKDIVFPLVVLSVSGGHSDLYRVSDDSSSLSPQDSHEIASVGPYFIKKLGTTKDDAAGEVFDKVARMLGGPYPGGRWIGEQAQQRRDSISKSNNLSEKSRFWCKRILLGKESLDFSFSGMKSQVYNHLKREGYESQTDPLCETHPLLVQEVAYEFEEAITDIMTKKVLRAAAQYHIQTVGVVGGVSANLRLREKVSAACDEQGYAFFLPKQFVYCMDNAAMIGLTGLVMSEK